MDSLNKTNYFHTAFSHIYVEKDIWNHPRSQSILNHFPDARKIEITHYKDVFCRKKQNVFLQHKVPMLILAAKRQNFLYAGSPVCHDFGEPYFYYTSCVMNCIYDCSYCYLKGMYPSGNLVIFVNLEDTFSEIETMLKKHKMYLCISYDTDLMALESLTGFVKAWVDFADRHKDLTIECRTKCARWDLWPAFKSEDNMIFAFTISPQVVIETQERKTPSLSDRICCARLAMEAGFPVRLCFDPMLYFPDWKIHYKNMLSQIVEQLPIEQVKDVSVGSFRISQDYLKKLRKVVPDSAIVQFPFENEQGVYHYPKALLKEMEQFFTDELKKYLPEHKIFHWTE